MCVCDNLLKLPLSLSIYIYTHSPLSIHEAPLTSRHFMVKISCSQASCLFLTSAPIQIPKTTRFPHQIGCLKLVYPRIPQNKMVHHCFSEQFTANKCGIHFPSIFPGFPHFPRVSQGFPCHSGRLPVELPHEVADGGPAPCARWNFQAQGGSQVLAEFNHGTTCTTFFSQKITKTLVIHTYIHTYIHTITYIP